MIDSNLFQNSQLLWPVSIVALILWILFLWKEWSSPLKNRFYLYCIVSLITLLSLAMLALKPLTTSENQSNTGVLLTDGYNEKRLDSLKKSKRGITILDYQENLPIGASLDSIRNLFVLGNGVAPYDFWQFENRSVTYLGTDVPDGIVDVKYARENVLGTDIIIEGRYHNAKVSRKLVFEDDNGHGLDSVMLNSAVPQHFELSTALKATGKFVFQIVEKDSLGKTISSEPVPFKVVDRTYLKILMVNGFPTFETKYLKNYLAEMGHKVVVRSQLTRGRYKFEYLNTKRTPVYRLGEKELESFDVLIIDGNSFRNLSNNSWKSIERTIKNTGMGLFIQPESSLFQKSSKRLGFEFERDGIGKVTLTAFSRLGLEKFPFKFTDADGVEIIHSSNKNPITAYKRMENGRIGTTLIQNTYQLQLDGKTPAYRRLWSEIVSKLSKRVERTSDWRVNDKFPLIHEPFQFELRTNIQKPKVFMNEENQIALRQDIDIPSLWKGTTYPRNIGWNSLHLEDKSKKSLDFYVLDSTAWQSLRAKKLQNKNRRYFASASAEQKEKTTRIPVNRLWFFLLGILGMSFLWMHPKLFPN